MAIATDQFPSVWRLPLAQAHPKTPKRACGTSDSLTPFSKFVDAQSGGYEDRQAIQTVTQLKPKGACGLQTYSVDIPYY